MIFIITGTQKFEFNRLLEIIDLLIENGHIKEPVFAQTGSSTYSPRYYQYEKYMSEKKFSNMIDSSSVIISHGGAGSIVQSVLRKKKVIAFPRLSIFNEHVDNHQLEITDVFVKKEYILAADSLNSLINNLNEIENKEFEQFETNNKIFINHLKKEITSFFA